MKITFFNNQSNHNVINKKIKRLNELNIVLKDDVNIVNPILLIKNFTGGNYAYIDKFNRYYYISSIELTGDIYKLFLNVDVLGSFKNDIINGDFFDEKIIEIPNDIDYETLKTDNQYLLITGVL